MANVSQLYKLRLFSLDDVIHTMHLSKAGAASSLRRWQEQGIIKMIRRNMYTVIDPATDAPLISRYELASNITSDSYVGWHTALEFHGFAHQPFYNAYVASGSRFKDLFFDGVGYEYAQTSIPATDENGVVKPMGNPYVRVTDLERTIVDCCDRIDRAGGIEELLHCLEGITLLDETKLIKYLQLYAKAFLYQKTGFILEQTKPRNIVSPEFIEFCRQKCATHTKRLTNSNDSDTFIKEWYLYVPHDILTSKEYRYELI